MRPQSIAEIKRKYAALTPEQLVKMFAWGTKARRDLEAALGISTKQR